MGLCECEAPQGAPEIVAKMIELCHMSKKHFIFQGCTSETSSNFQVTSLTRPVLDFWHVGRRRARLVTRKVAGQMRGKRSVLESEASSL